MLSESCDYRGHLGMWRQRCYMDKAIITIEISYSVAWAGRSFSLMSTKWKYIRLVHNPAQKIMGWEGQSKVWQQIEITETASVWKEQLSVAKTPVTNERLHAGSPQIKMNYNKIVDHYSKVSRGNNKCWQSGMCNAEINDPPFHFCMNQVLFQADVWLESVRRSRIWQKPCGERGKMALSQESPGVCWLILYHENIFCGVCVCVCACTQLCSVLCNPMDCSPSGFSVHGIF